MWSRGRVAAGLAGAVALGVGAGCSSALEAPRPVHGATGASTGFSIAGLRAGQFPPVSGSESGDATSRELERQGLRILQINEGRPAIVDTSMLTEGIASATTPGGVDLSWDLNTNATGYTVIRDGQKVAALPAQTHDFRDPAVRPGATYRYTVVPTLSGTATATDRVWSMTTTVPSRVGRGNALAALETQGRAVVSAASAAPTTTLSWITFIPQARIDAPFSLKLCEYGPGYQFAGDGHSAFDWTSPRYRTALHATITWKSKAVVGNKAVGASHVYKKSTGKLVATKTASTSGMSATKLGSGSNWVDVRMVTHASNPFCSSHAGAIDGAFTMHLTQSGNYAITSGSHRQMPNHYIYLYNGGRVTNVYTRAYASAYCLVGSMACPLANITGYYGRFVS